MSRRDVNRIRFCRDGGLGSLVNRRRLAGVEIKLGSTGFGDGAGFLSCGTRASIPSHPPFQATIVFLQGFCGKAKKTYAWNLWEYGDIGCHHHSFGATFPDASVMSGRWSPSVSDGIYK